MGYELLSNASQKYWHCQQGNFGFYLDLAEHFDWLPEHKEDHYYLGNNLQVVSDKDALAMARALERAIAYIENVSPVNMAANGETLTTFDKKDVKHLRDLVDLARTGSFTIA